MDRSGRNFFYGLLAASPERRQFILWHWLSNWPKGSSWEDFVRVLLYQKADFIVESERILILGPRLPIRMDWLTHDERQFLVWTVFAQRHTLFQHVKVLPNHMVQLQGYKGSQDYFDDVWRRQLMRDVAVWLAYDEAVQPALFHFMECIHALALARGDVWLFQLHAALSGHGSVEYLPCWGHGPFDDVVPSKVRHQRQQQAKN